MTKQVLGGFITFTIGILGNLIASLLFQNWNIKDSSIPMIILLTGVTIVGILVGAYIDSRSEGATNTDFFKSNRSLIYWSLTGSVVVIIFLLGVNAILSGPNKKEPYTLYFVIDSTEKMADIFNDVRNQVQLATKDVKSDSRIGLRVYGGDEKQGGVVCQDSRQLMEPYEYPEARQMIDLVLAGIHPSGQSSMTGAALEALINDTKNEKRSIKLILITSGIDPKCDSLAANILNDRAKDIGKNVELILISVGEQDDNSKKIFMSYAKEFRGFYLPVADAKNLPNVIKSISFYGYGYEYGYGY